MVSKISCPLILFDPIQGVSVDLNRIGSEYYFDEISSGLLLTSWSWRMSAVSTPRVARREPASSSIPGQCTRLDREIPRSRPMLWYSCTTTLQQHYEP